MADDILKSLTTVYKQLRDRDPIKDVPKHYICCIQPQWERKVQEEVGTDKPLSFVIGRRVWITPRWPFTNAEQVMAFVDPSELYKHDAIFAENERQIVERLFEEFEHLDENEDDENAYPYYDEDK